MCRVFFIPQCVMYRMCYTRTMIHFEEELNEEQYNVVTCADGPCLVLAGAGSGKTRTITYRVAYLLQQGVPQEHILLLTFTNRAAKEMMERITQLMGMPLDGITGGTFHSVAVRILRQYANFVDYGTDFTILDQDDAEGMMSLAMRDEGIDLKSKTYPKPKQMVFLTSFMRNAQMTIDDVIEIRYPGYANIRHVIERAFVAYTQKKREANVMDFDDLLEQLLLLLSQHKGVREQLSGRYKYILVDEYQDTNRMQSSIISHLSSVHSNVLTVGDDAQSIYSFRAADINNILDFENHYNNAKVFRLQTNYRSVPEILDLANNIIKKNKKQYKKELKATNEAFQKPRLVQLNNQFEEAEYIAMSIRYLLDAGVPAQEIAVLFRATFHSQPVEVELLKRGIPYDYRGGLRFFERAHIKDILSFCRIAFNIHDVIAWQRVLKLQAGIGDKTATKIIMALKELATLTDVVQFDLASELPARAHQGWETLQAMFTGMVNAQGDVSRMIEAIIQCGYKDYLEERYSNSTDRIQDIEQLQILGDRVKSLEKFLTDTSLSDEFSKGNKTQDGKVILSTIHQSKGLEWDSVIMMRMVQGGLPNERALSEDGGIEEERRLFYVAITRARKHLILTYPIVGGYDGMTMYEPSMFLSDIDPELIDSDQDDEQQDIIAHTAEDDFEYVADGGWSGSGFLSDVSDL